MSASNRHPGLNLPTKNGVGSSFVVLPAGAWPTIADFLAQRFPHISPDEWNTRMKRGDVLDAQGATLPPDSVYQANTRVYYYRSPPTELHIPLEETVLFQDEWIVVADKPHYLPVTPSGRYLQETLLVRLKRRLGIDTLSPAHRIDRDTAGLVLLTIQPHTRDAYQSLFRQKTVEKIYEAIAPFRSDLALPPVIHTRLVESASFMQMHVAEGEPNTETAIAVLEVQNNLARYELRPVTGRKHQLRAQMSALGIAIVNDRIYPYLYPELAMGEAPDYEQPLQLLAKSLSFTDPITGQLRQFESLQCLTL